MTQGIAFEPTAERRNQVEVLAGFGLPQVQIAVLIGCDPKTLRKHFDQELAVGDARATAKVAQTLYAKAIGGDTASLIFWLKARAGWREKHEVVLSTKAPELMTDEELEAEIAHARMERLAIDVD